MKKVKITYSHPNLSALAIQNLARAVSSDISITKNAKPTDRAEVYNCELKVDTTSYFGELTIMSYLVAHANQSRASDSKIMGQGCLNLNYDNLMYSLNSRLRPEADAFAITAKNSESAKDKIKVIAKELEESGVMEALLDSAKVCGAAMVFSYLEPVQKLVNKKMQTALKALKTKYGFISLDDLGNDSAAVKKTGDISTSKSDAKIHRVNRDTVLPKDGRRNILITSALPYVNNVPHLGNIIGCVLSADVFARYARLAGHNAIYVCGTDEYGTATETKAMQEGKTCQQICDHYHAIHKKIYDWFDCDFDRFGRTSTPKQTEIAQDIFNDIVAQSNTFEKVVDQQYCKKCERFLADRFVRGECPMCHYGDAKGDQCDGCGKLINATELINPQCSSCSTTPEVRQSKHIFIDLPKIQPDLEKWVSERSKNWSANSVSFTNTMLKGGLLGRCITRDLKWGTPVPLEEFKNKVFYVWFDAPIGYISITANYTDEWKKWWQNEKQVELFQFMGKDNITFHTVIFPSTLIGTAKPWTKLHTISTTEFLNYEVDEKTGKPKKFSKSRNSGVFGDDAMNTGVPSEVWRYYLLINRPENQDTVFLWSDFIAKNNNELLANLGNFSNRILKFLASSFKKVIPAYPGAVTKVDQDFIDNLMKRFNKWVELMEQIKLKDALRSAMELSSECNLYIQENQPWALAKTDAERCAQVMNVALNALMLICMIFEPFMPSFSAKVYEQMAVVRTAVHEQGVFNLLQSGKFLELIKGGHVIGTPEPIFREIKAAEGDEWKKKFGGD